MRLPFWVPSAVNNINELSKLIKKELKKNKNPEKVMKWMKELSNLELQQKKLREGGELTTEHIKGILLRISDVINRVVSNHDMKMEIADTIYKELVWLGRNVSE